MAPSGNTETVAVTERNVGSRSGGRDGGGGVCGDKKIAEGEESSKLVAPTIKVFIK